MSPRPTMDIIDDIPTPSVNQLNVTRVRLFRAVIAAHRHISVLVVANTFLEIRCGLDRIAIEVVR